MGFITHLIPYLLDHTFEGIVTNSILKIVSWSKCKNRNSSVVILCFVGVPSPSILWVKNGKELFECDRVRTWWEHNKAQCRLLAVSADDTGKYTCTASNPTGTASCTADLVVKSEAQHVTLIKHRTLQAYLKHCMQDFCWDRNMIQGVS